MIPVPPLVNGRSYAWADVVVNIGGRPIKGITAISYSDEQEIEDNIGIANQPISRGFGAVNYTGSITLDMEEVEALQATSPTRRVQDLPFFDISVSYINGAKTVTHRLVACTLVSNGRELETNQKRVSVEMELRIGKIEWNG